MLDSASSVLANLAACRIAKKKFQQFQRNISPVINNIPNSPERFLNSVCYKGIRGQRMPLKEK